MRNAKRIVLPLLLILLGVIACGLPVVPQTDESANATAVAKTLSAIFQVTEDAGSSVDFLFTNTPMSFPTSTSTPLPAPSTATPWPSSTWTPFPTATFTPGVPMVTVSTPTNCRVGPGKVYDLVGALYVGEWAQIYGRDPTGQYWYIRNPDAGNSYCWLWGEYAIISGSTYGLPVYYPPPTPTPKPTYTPSRTPTPTRTPTPSPSFDASFGGLEQCSGFWVDVKLHNTGTVTFESVNLTIRDSVNSKVLTVISDEFVNNNGCNSPVKKPTLQPGKTLSESSPKFGYNPKGHKLKAVITLCSKPGLNGVCTTRTINFTP